MSCQNPAIRKLVIRRRVEGLNVLLNMHRMRRSRYNKEWHALVEEAARSSSVTENASLIETTSQAVARLSATLSDIAAL